MTDREQWLRMSDEGPAHYFNGHDDISQCGKARRDAGRWVATCAPGDSVVNSCKTCTKLRDRLIRLAN